MSSLPGNADRSALAVGVMQSALSLAVKRFKEGPEAVTDAEIERAAELFGVSEEDADQIMLIYEKLVAFGNSVAGWKDRLTGSASPARLIQRDKVADPLPAQSFAKGRLPNPAECTSSFAQPYAPAAEPQRRPPGCRIKI